VNDSNATGNNTGNPDTTPEPKMPPVLPPPPARPPTSSLPVQPPAATHDPTLKETPANDAPSAENQATGSTATDTPSAGSKQTLLKVGAVVVCLVLLGLLTWWVVTLIANGTQQAANQPSASGTTESASPSSQPSRGQLPLDGVSALDYQLGDCFENFDPEATESRVVPCTSGHSAQLIAVHRYPESDSYPGIAALREKGREICQGAGLTDAVANYVLMQRNAYPSDTSWEQGDRRVDCYVTADKGNIIMESLIPSAGP
jgi:hypothetical protein